MDYLDIAPTIHLISQPLDRKKTNIEIILTSGGSWFEEPEDRGRKHLLEHCIVSRTKSMNFQQLKDYTFRENIYVNAYTGPKTMGFETGGHYLDFKKMIDLIIEVVFEPTFDQNDLDREKEIVLREISERRGDPSYKLHYDTMKQVFTSDSSDNHETLGDSEIVAQTKLEDFRKLHDNNLKRSHIYICVSGGGIDNDYITQKLNTYLKNKKELFEVSESKNPVDFILPSKYLPFITLPIVHELAHKHAEVSVYIDLPISWENDPSIKIFNNLYMKYGGILYDRLRDELGLVYGIGCGFSKKHQQVIINFSSEIKNIDPIIKEIKKTFSSFDIYFKPQKFQEFKNVLYKQQEIAEDSAGSMINFSLSTLQNYGKLESYESYTNRIKDVSISNISEIYDNIKKALKTMRVVIVSSDKEVQKFSEISF
jgi:predicted Zn-dependent peptidase